MNEWMKDGFIDGWTGYYTVLLNMRVHVCLQTVTWTNIYRQRTSVMGLEAEQKLKHNLYTTHYACIHAFIHTYIYTHTHIHTRALTRSHVHVDPRAAELAAGRKKNAA